MPCFASDMKYDERMENKIKLFEAENNQIHLKQLLLYQVAYCDSEQHFKYQEKHNLI